MVALSHMVGTCNLGYLYNLGGQHGATRLEINGFADELNRLISPGRFSWFICTTNGSQEHERKMLDALGFKYSNEGRMRSHTISFAKFRKNYKERGWDVKSKAEAEARKLAKIEAMKNRPRDENGRLLRKDGKIIRKPREFFTGDRLSITRYCFVKVPFDQHQYVYTVTVTADSVTGGNIKTNHGDVRRGDVSTHNLVHRVK
jgi:hypothetical protein